MDHGAAECLRNFKGKINDGVSANPDFTQEFIVTTDASAYAIGAVLSQGGR